MSAAIACIPRSNSIPTSLRAFSRWVCWHYELRGEKQTKVPVQPDGRPAKSNDPATWVSFEACLRAARSRGWGIGFVLGDGFVGIDLDGVRDPETGALEASAQAIVDELRSYAEISPSGAGVHILCRGTLPPGRRRNVKFEAYDGGRFFTVTGARLNDFDVEDRTAELASLHARIFGGASRNGRQKGAQAEQAAPDASVIASDDELIMRACAASPKFARLWQGRWEGEYDSHSEADLALCSLLAYWTNGDGERIDRLFRRSGLMRAKWERPDYRAATIEKAVEAVVDRDAWTATRAEATAGAPAAEENRFVSFPLTDSGNAERLVLRYGADLRFCHPQNRWYIWTGRRWEPDLTGRVMEFSKQIARELYQRARDIPDPERRKQAALWALRCESTDKKRAALVSAQSESGIPILPEQFDSDPFLLNCLNGTVDLRTGELRPHRREDYCSRLAPAVYDSAARCKSWECFLEEACDGDRELIEFLQRAVGYSLTGSTAEEKLFFVHGPGGAGKSTFVEAVKAVLGDYAKTADFESFIARPAAGGVRNDIAELAGRRLVISVEVDEGRRLAEGLVKMLTGGDSVRARFLYQESFEYTPTFKLWLISNQAPRIKHNDSAMWRRILRVPFEHVIPPERRDPAVKARLKDVKECGSGILAWAVEGCLRWLEEGLAPPERVVKATEQLRLAMDPLRDFIADLCVLSPHAWTPAAKLREAYERYCAESGERHPLGAREFAKALQERGCLPERRHAGRGWRGIGLLVEEVGRDA